MKAEIKVPAMGESISEATVGSFLKAEGSVVKADDELLELETDKVNQVLYASQAGVVSWSVAEGDTVKIGQSIGSIDDSKEGTAAKESPPVAQSKEVVKNPTKDIKKNSPKSETKDEETKNPVVETEKPVISASAPKAASSGNRESSQGARSTKNQFLADLNENRDQSVSDYSRPSSPQLSTSTGEAAVSRGETRKKMSKVRRVIAERLVNVLQETAMLTTFNEVDMTKIIALRETYKEAFAKQHQVRLGFMPFFVKAVVSGLKAFPEINAYIDGDEIVYRNYYDIGIAVGTDKGLFVPVVRNCDSLSFADIDRSIESFANKAREGKLIADDLQGGGFTITNGGTYGSLFSTPIINPPQSAILGMHKIMKRPVVIDDQIVIRQMMYLALSYDHRVVDGKEAVSFLVNIKNALEDPSRLLIGI
jgi:2-oxoglutarate dehydrogenase E2 component (dihydrolipoamide succinyltransferase)